MPKKPEQMCYADHVRAHADQVYDVKEAIAMSKGKVMDWTKWVNLRIKNYEYR